MHRFYLIYPCLLVFLVIGCSKPGNSVVEVTSEDLQAMQPSSEEVERMNRESEEAAKAAAKTAR